MFSKPVSCPHLLSLWLDMNAKIRESYFIALNELATDLNATVGIPKIEFLDFLEELIDDKSSIIQLRISLGSDNKRVDELRDQRKEGHLRILRIGTRWNCGYLSGKVIPEEWFLKVVKAACKIKLSKAKDSYEFRVDCKNGKLFFHAQRNQNICVCSKNYYGPNCQHRDLRRFK